MALTVLGGYVFRVPSLITLKQNLQGMSPLTALGLLDLGVGLMLQSFRWRGVALATAWSALLLGAALLVVQVWSGSDALSPSIEVWLGFLPAQAAQVSIASAFSIAVLGLSLLLDARPVLSDFLALVVGLVACFALLGYAYGVLDLYALTPFHTLAMHTAAALLILSVATVLLRPQRNWCGVVAANTEAGAASRRQLAFLLTPIASGWLLRRGIEQHLIGSAAAMALLVIVTVVSLGLLILRDASRQAQLEEERRLRSRLLDSHTEEMTERLAAQEIEIRNHADQQVLAEKAALKAQRLEALSRLTGGIAHDFNNLLQALGGTLELIGRRVKSGKPIDEHMKRAQEAIARGGRLGTKLLAFSGTQKLHIRAIALDDLFDQLRPLLSAALGSRIAVTYDLHVSGRYILTDDDQFELALLNLALNAKDAIEGRGQVTLTAVLKRLALEPGTEESDFVSIQMTDSGMGMSPEVAARAMEPFFSTKPRDSASGLGLAQVHGFMRQSRGDVRIQSQVGAGTRVELLFPRVDPPEVRMAGGMRLSPSVAAVPTLQRPLILVIDDDESVRFTIVEGLRASGYDVAEAGDGAAGIELSRTLAPAAAIIDFIMPVLDGAEVARRVRALQPKLPIVFVSGHFDTAALEPFGMSVILRKPFELDHLQRTLEEIL